MPNVLKTRVVKFQFCHDGECDFGEGELHLVIETSYVELRRGSARALSYTWGEFDRKQTEIGHYKDGRRATMELGQEWDILELVVTLQDLCLEPDQSQYCWIDQLCIAQDDAEEVRSTLAKIPDIYRNFDVIVLFPGSLCECQLRALDYLEAAVVADPSQQGKIYPNVNVGLCVWSQVMVGACFNNLSYYAWFSRLWTRQELMYASRINTRWTGQNPSSCPTSVLDLDKHNTENIPIISYEQNTKDLLSSYVENMKDFYLSHEQISSLEPTPRLWCERWMDEMENSGSSSPDTRYSNIQQKLIDVSNVASVEAGESLKNWAAFHSADKRIRGEQSIVLRSRFICGVTFESQLPPIDKYKEEEKVNHFLHMLCGLIRTKRSATQLRDYVVAVWVDCPKYILPQGYKDMELPLLLQDAVKQLESNHGVSVATNALAGLFGCEGPSALWRPALYLDSVAVRAADDIYGPLLVPKHHYGIYSEERLPLTRRPGTETPPANKVYNYDQIFATTPSADVFDFMVCMVKTWPINIIFSYRAYAMSPEHNRALLDKNDMTELFCKEVMHSASRDVIERQPAARVDNPGLFLQRWNISWKHREEIDHKNAVYRLVCKALRLNEKMSRDKNLRLMVDRGSHDSPPRIGLTWLDFDSEDDLTTCTIRAASPFENDYQEKGLFEAIETDVGEDVPTYRLIGVWVPSVDFPDSKVEKFANPYGKDGYLI
ncbi:MAG: hypothetical protein M1834_009596 [Cirrosporium novae-zelandiae]|nr:MAG: hypothetical protein M1834_009596 [Cirrosporium novae-zelandiae]